MSYEIGIGDRQGKISSIAPSGAAAPVQSKPTEQVDHAFGSTISNADHTDLSSMAAIVSQALRSSDVRTEKVASLQQAISAGSYSISSSDVASKLVQSLLE